MNMLHVENLLYAVCYLDKYVEEHYLFKVGMSIHAGRSHATILKKSNKVQEIKYLQEEYKRKYEGKITEMRAIENQLAECIIELATMITSISLFGVDLQKGHVSDEFATEFSSQTTEKARRNSLKPLFLFACRRSRPARSRRAFSSKHQSSTSPTKSLVPRYLLQQYIVASSPLRSRRFPRFFLLDGYSIWEAAI
ncbi:hypothetical protein M5K25_020311 [Dendrobium thyrsiflorum]|uniref:Uncharacterized protein n=1 Tax=Dendrobium thyrsiflorum TaxID=117978 RepID=A0ABD0U9I4_DENTH